MTVNYYYFNSSVVKLCNTYHNNVYYKTKLRFAFLIVIDSIKIVNSLRVIDEGEVCGQYRLARIRPKTTDNETTYINTSYDQLQDNYLNDEKYGVKFSIDSNSKFIKKIEFTSAFFTNYAPNLKDKFEKIEVLNNGKAIVIK